MGRATRRNSSGRVARSRARGGGLQGRELRGHFRWRLHELPLPVAQRTVPPASAASVVVVSSSASSFRPRPGGGWLGRSLARFSDPLFHRRSFSLSLSLVLLTLSPSSLVLQKLHSLSGAGPRCNETSHNGVTWPLLSRSPYSPVIPYRLYFSLGPRVAHPTEGPSLSIRLRVLALHYAYPPAR